MNIYDRLRVLVAPAVVAVGCTLAAAALAAPTGAASLLHFRAALGRAERATAPGPAWPSRASAQFRTVDVPGAAGTAGITGVNNRGTLVGTWANSQGGFFGFIEQPGGQPTTFSVPGATGVTVTSGINDVGTALAYSIDSSGVSHGWVRSPGGDFTQLDDPLGAGGTTPGGINDRGVIVGFYFAASGALHGFVYDHGTFTTLDYPGAPATFLIAVNSSGASVGGYVDASGVTHGFLYEHGTFTTIDAPGAGTAPGQGSAPSGISSSGVIDGAMTNDAGSFGWLLSKGQFSSLNDPVALAQSMPLCLSSNGRVVGGDYFDASGVIHGYVATLTPGGA
jgi:hypothetical protein